MAPQGPAGDEAEHVLDPRQLAQWDRRHIIHGEGALRPDARPTPLMLVGGEGCTVETADGRRLLDGYAGLVLCQLGYGCDAVVRAMAQAAVTLSYGHLYSPHSHPWAARLARELAERTPGDLDQVFFTAGGAEAVETAVKLCRLVHLADDEPQRRHIIAFQGGYHGSTLGALALAGFPERRRPYRPWLMEVHHAPQPDPLRFSADGETLPSAREMLAPVQSLIERLEPSHVAAVVIEPIQGVGGMADPGRPFLKGLADLCSREGIHLIMDEVMTGFGRTGTLFACEQAGVVPDFMALAKGMTAGHAALGAALMRTRLAARFPGDARFVHGITFGGHPAACAAALQVLEELEAGQLLAATRRHGSRVEAWGRELAASLSTVQRVMGRGLLWGIQLHLPEYQRQLLGDGRLAALVAQLALNRDLLVGFSPERDVVHFSPPLNVEVAQLDQMLERLRGACEELETMRAQQPGRLELLLTGHD